MTKMSHISNAIHKINTWSVNTWLLGKDETLEDHSAKSEFVYIRRVKNRIVIVKNRAVIVKNRAVLEKNGERGHNRRNDRNCAPSQWCILEHSRPLTLCF